MQKKMTLYAGTSRFYLVLYILYKLKSKKKKNQQDYAFS